MFEIIWPEHRWIAGDKLAVWFSDAVANDEIAEEYRSSATAEEMARALSDAGLITLGRGRK